MQRLENNIKAIFGQDGEKWLANLDGYIASLAQRWQLNGLTPLENLSFNYVLGGMKGDEAVILKVGMDIEALKLEAEALKIFQNHGGIKLLEYEDGALLLERAMPGETLKVASLDSTLKLNIACRVMSTLHQAPMLHHQTNFPHTRDWLATLNKPWEIPTSYLKRARIIRDKLEVELKGGVLLHGDLHMDNILRSGTNWCAIDPKGVIGHPMHELWAFTKDLDLTIENLAYVSELCHYDLRQVIECNYMHAVLAMCWCLEDKLSPEPFIPLVEKLYARLPLR